MKKTGRLELTWVGKYDESVVEPRILLEDKDKSYGDPQSENMLIHGDNLIALQALQQDFSGKSNVYILIRLTTQEVPLIITTTILNTVYGCLL